MRSFDHINHELDRSKLNRISGYSKEYTNAAVRVVALPLQRSASAPADEPPSVFSQQWTSTKAEFGQISHAMWQVQHRCRSWEPQELEMPLQEAAVHSFQLRSQQSMQPSHLWAADLLWKADSSCSPTDTLQFQKGKHHLARHPVRAGCRLRASLCKYLCYCLGGKEHILCMLTSRYTGLPRSHFKTCVLSDSHKTAPCKPAGFPSLGHVLICSFFPQAKQGLY